MSIALSASAPRILDLFAGAGGAAWGCHEAGCRHVLCVERDPQAAATLRKVGFAVAEGDLRLWTDPSFPSPPVKLPQRVDGVWASPPCQPWSGANQHEGVKGEDDPERNGWPMTLQILRDVKPRRAVMENVLGSRRYVLAKIVPKLRKQFPFVALWTLNAKNFGVPQSRTRIFVVCAEKPLDPPIPDAGLVTLRDLLGIDYDKPSPCVSATEYKGASSQKKWIRLNRASDALALATQGARRRFTLDEAAAIQTFPVAYPFQGTLQAQFRQIGNAVPPELARRVARAVFFEDSTG